MGIKELKIIFNKDEGEFHPGEIIDGFIRVNVEGTGDMTIRGVKIHLYGNCNVHFTHDTTESNGETEEIVTTHFLNHENYIDEEVYLMGKGGFLSKLTSLPSGSSDFQFRFEIPKRIPETFEGACGEIQYKIKASINLPLRANKETIKYFNISHSNNVDDNPNNKIPKEITDTYNLGCLCFKSGPLSILMKTNRSGYSPGDDIIFNSDIENNSNKDIKKYTVQFIKREVYNGYCSEDPIDEYGNMYRPETKKEERSNKGFIGVEKEDFIQPIVRIEKGSIPRGKSDTIINEKITIPENINASNLDYCTMIQIEYYMQLLIHFGRFTKDYKLLLPIIIGNKVKDQ